MYCSNCCDSHLHTNREEKFSFISCTNCPLLLNFDGILLPLGSLEKTCICARFGVKAFLISVSLKVRECENYTLYYVPLEVIRWNKCDVHTVVFVVGKLQQKLKCRGGVSSITRVFTILIGK